MTTNGVDDDHLPSVVDPPFPAGNLAVGVHLPVIAGGFNDAETADVILRVILDPGGDLTEATPDTIPAGDQSEFRINLHSRVVGRSNYLSGLLSDPQSEWHSGNYRFRLTVTAVAEPDSINHHITVLQLLYSEEDLLPSIESVSTALDLLPVALELAFDDCIAACVRFLEAAPWSDDEEEKVIRWIPHLDDEDSRGLVARLSPETNDSSDKMLHALILSAVDNQPNAAFVAKLLRDISSRESARKALEGAFQRSLDSVKWCLEEYCGDHDEDEDDRRVNLRAAMASGKQLPWLVERMVELGAAEAAVGAWSEQASLTAGLQRAYGDEPSLAVDMLRCTSELANAVATGNVLVAKQVKIKLVRDWLPVLIICKDSASPVDPNHNSLYLDLEKTFLKIILTLPLSDAQDLLQHCLGLSTRNVDDCHHLVAVFTTWFRRATRAPQL